jgi:hypothetical protein
MDRIWRFVKSADLADSDLPDPPTWSDRMTETNYAVDVGCRLEGAGFDQRRWRLLEWRESSRPDEDGAPDQQPTLDSIDYNRPWAAGDSAYLKGYADQILREHDFPQDYDNRSRYYWRWDERRGLAWVEASEIGPRGGSDMFATPDGLLERAEACSRWPAECNLRWALRVANFFHRREGVVKRLSTVQMDEGLIGEVSTILDQAFDLGVWITNHRLRHLHDASLRAGHKALADGQTRSAKMSAVNISKQRRVEERRQEVLAIVRSVLEAWSKDGTGLYKRAALVQAVIDKSAKRFDERNWRTLERDVKHLLESGALEIPTNLLKPRRSRAASAAKP